MHLHIPLTKIDEEKRLVIGIGAREEADRSREILDYESSVPAFKSWSDGFSLATNGLSKGNLRAMHRRDIVAGTVVDLGFDDDAKSIKVCAKVVDDNEWRKVLAGAYTGFSIGGGYAKRWPDPTDATLTRYTPDVREISLVDNPCIPSARFAELVKVDGSVTEIPLIGAPAETFGALRKNRPLTFAEMMAGRPLTFAEMAKRTAARPRGHRPA